MLDDNFEIAAAGVPDAVPPGQLIMGSRFEQREGDIDAFCPIELAVLLRERETHPHVTSTLSFIQKREKTKTKQGVETGKKFVMRCFTLSPSFLKSQKSRLESSSGEGSSAAGAEPSCGCCPWVVGASQK